MLAAARASPPPLPDAPTPNRCCPMPAQLFGVHAFTSDRKRMSVVVQSPDGQYLLLAKGADNVIFGLANTSQSDNRVLVCVPATPCLCCVPLRRAAAFVHAAYRVTRLCVFCVSRTVT